MKTPWLSLRRFALHIVVLAPLLAACGDDGNTVVDQGPPPDMRRVFVLSGARSGIGEECQEGRSPKGTCSGSAEGLICLLDGELGFAGGYCTSDCLNTGCPDDSQCVRIDVGLDMCLAACNTDADCRTPDYVCSDYQVCVPKDGFDLGGGEEGGGE
jgi:hypothetical protein